MSNESSDETAMVPVKTNEIGGYRDIIEFAQLMAKAAMLPTHLHGNPGNCLAVVSIARSWGMSPFMVGQATSLIPKRGGGETLMFEGKLVQAAINNSGKLTGRLAYKFTGSGDKTTCEVSGRVKGENEAVSIVIGMPATQNSPLWKGQQSDKEQQLSYLATRTWARRYLPEVMLGVYTPEDDWSEAKDAPGVAEAKGRLSVLQTGNNAPSAKPDEKAADPFTGEKKPVVDLDPIHEKPVCPKCEGRGVIEDSEGKGPCPVCKGLPL